MKTLKPRFRFLKYLFWLSPFLVIMGVTAGVVSNTWGAIPLGLIVGGVTLGALGLVLGSVGTDPNRPSFWGSRSTQANSNAFVSTIAVLLILGLINFLAFRNSVRFDLTDARLFTLSQESDQVLQNLKQDVKLWVFDPQQNAKDRDLLETYQRKNTKFSFAFVDPDADPGLAEKFGVKNSSAGGGSRDVYLEVPSTQRNQFVQIVNQQVRLSEPRITNGILQITSDKRTKIYFVQGHGEKGLQQGENAMAIAAKVLEDKNYINEPLNLAQGGKVPSDAVTVLVIGPTRNLLEAETKALQDYLNQGGSVMIAIDPNTKPGVEGLLNEWGIKMDDRVAINAPEQQIQGVGPAGLVVTEYGAHPITKNFRGGISFYALARPLDITNVPGIQNTPLLLTNPKSWAESNLKEQPLKLDGGDRPGPLTIGVALTRTVNPAASPSPSASPTPSPTASPTASPTPSPSASPTPSPSPSPQPNATPKEARLVVFGNSAFAGDRYFTQQLNGDVFINSVNWLSQQGQPLSVRAKDVKNRRINLNVEQAQILWIVSLLLVPLFGFLSAGFLWWRRR